MRLLFLVLLFLPGPLRADAVIDRVLDRVVLPGVTVFAAKTAVLAAAARADCTATSPELRQAWNAAMDAWFDIQDLRFGPLDRGESRMAIAFWPDFRGSRTKLIARILSGADPILETPEHFPQMPVSVRGLYAIEALLYDPRFNGFGPSDPGCALLRLVAGDLALLAADLRDQWLGGYADLMRSAGGPGNEEYIEPREARQAVFTALLMGLQFDAVERLGLPLATADRPRPKRAEGRLSGRSQRNLELSLAAHDRLAQALVPDVRANILVREDFERVRWMAAELDDPDFSGVTNAAARLRLEALQAAITIVRTDVNTEFSKLLGVTMGLNAWDGD